MFEIGSKVKYLKTSQSYPRDGFGVVVDIPEKSIWWSKSDLQTRTWVLWPNTEGPYWTYTRDLCLADISDITEVKLIFNGKNRKRSRMVSVIFEEEIGITLYSPKKLYLCLHGPKSPLWKESFDDRLDAIIEDFEYFKKAILSGVVDLTVKSPYDKKYGKTETNSISSTFCAFS